MPSPASQSASSSSSTPAPKVSKTIKKTAPEPPVPAPTPAPQPPPIELSPQTSPQPAPLPPPPAKEEPKKKTKKVAPEEPSQAPPPAPTSTPSLTPEEPTPAPEEEDKTSNVLQTLVQSINQLSLQFKEVQNLIKPVVKEYEKHLKIIEKTQKKRDNARKSPSGFAKPNKISNELCDFIGEPYGTEKSRTEITRFINAYVKEHNLNKPSNRRVILPDEKLKKILNIHNDEEVTFFILQRLISHHFPQSASKSQAPAPTPTPA